MKTRAEMMKIWRRRWRIKQRNQFYNLGLRSDGRPRLTDRRPMTQCERRRHQRLMRKIRYQRFASRRKAAGLTVRGTRPVYGVRKTITRFDVWQDFRSQISGGLISIEDIGTARREMEKI